MNAFLKAQQAYGAANAPLRSASDLEYEAIARVTRRLTDADASKDRDYPSFVAALHQNRKLWSLFAAEVVDSGNKLPEDLRASLFSLAEFSRRHTSKVLAGSDTIAPLVDINMAILRGLQAQRG